MKKLINKWINKIRCGLLKRCIEPNDIDKDQMQELIKEGAILIDVRSPQEYAEGHFEGAICIPEYDIQKEIEKTINNKEQKIVLYCDSGGRSKKAQKKLEKMGYSAVYNLYKGIG